MTEVHKVERHVPKSHLLLHFIIFIILSFLYYLSSKILSHNFSEKSALIFALALFSVHGIIAYLFSRKNEVTETMEKQEVANPDYDPNNLY